MKELSIDIETYSPIDLARRGVYKYAEHPDFSILLFGYAVDDGEVKVVDLAKGERIPEEILLALTDPLVTKWAFNAAFERVCLSRYLREHCPSHFLSYGKQRDTVGKYLDPLGWKCSQVLASSLGFPLSLKDLGEALGLSEKKMDEGSCLIGLFSWAGRHIQLQNLPQNHLEDLLLARSLVMEGDYEKMDFLYGSVPDTLSQLIRTAFVARKGYTFIVSDFSSIEARVLSYMAREKWRMDVFAGNLDIYAQSASKMFSKPVVKGGINSELRQKGKIAELALGYGGGEGALMAMGALDMGLTREELPKLVNSWRNANPHIASYWWQVDRAVREAIEQLRITRVGSLTFYMKKGTLFIALPSGRRLAYPGAALKGSAYGKTAITYMGLDTKRKWNRIDSYGPKFVENIIQAISRDILAYAMHNLRDYFICGHVHDEVIVECREGTPVEEITGIMEKTPDWMPGLLLRADGYETRWYRKM